LPGTASKRTVQVDQSAVRDIVNYLWVVRVLLERLCTQFCNFLVHQIEMFNQTFMILSFSLSRMVGTRSMRNDTSPKKLPETISPVAQLLLSVATPV